MSGLLGWLITSAAFALVGTVLRGILRPISWATLALAAISFGSEQIGEALNTLQGDRPTPNSTSEPAPTSTIVSQEPASPTSSPSALATTGWQSAANALANPIASIPGRNISGNAAGLPPTTPDSAPASTTTAPDSDSEGLPPPVSGLW